MCDIVRSYDSSLLFFVSYNFVNLFANVVFNEVSFYNYFS
jgi:hypothetical protein